ncbi:MAG: hypothetical protein N2C13_03980 [Chloroflexota bacterium]
MNKKVFIGISVVGILALTLVATNIAFAQGRGPSESGGYGSQGLTEGEEGPLHELMEASMAEALGLTVEEFEARHEAGESFFDIALTLGYDADEARELMFAARDAAFEQALEQGLISEGQGFGSHMGFGHGGGQGHDGECPYGEEGMGNGSFGNMMGNN